eukprot:g7768.t1
MEYFIIPGPAEPIKKARGLFSAGPVKQKCIIKIQVEYFSWIAFVPVYLQ